MEKKITNQNRLLMWLVWILEGVACGFGAILPGVSGGALMVAFGVYRPLIETITHIKKGLRKYGMMIVMFVIGAGAGFVGLSGLTAFLLERYETVVTCAFIGFIAGTFPELWHDAGEQQGHRKGAVIGLFACFAVMCGILTLLDRTMQVTIPQNFIGWVICGVLWGLSFVVPGLSSSSLLLFFGLYEPMMAGISSFDFGILIPMGIGMAACVLGLSRSVDSAFRKHHAMISHALLGIVAATAVMILPGWQGFGAACINLLFIAGGFVVSWLFTVLSARIKAKYGDKEDQLVDRD